MPKFYFVLAKHPLFSRYVMLHISVKYATLSKLHSIKYIFLFSEVCSPKRVNLTDNSAENILCCEILHYLEFIYWTENQDGDDNVSCVDRAHGYAPTPVSHFHVAKPDLPFCSTFIGHAPFQDANLI